MRYLLILWFVLLASPAFAQLPDAPSATKHAKRDFWIGVGANVAGDFALAGANWSGARDCMRREELHRVPSHEFGKTLAISGGVTVALSVVAWKLRYRHPTVSKVLLFTAAGAKFGGAVAEKGAGCN